MPENFYPGRRLSFSGELCTVRYLGPVSGTTGEWVGVEWDDTSRGKHNGSYEGVKYFECGSGWLEYISKNGSQLKAQLR